MQKTKINPYFYIIAMVLIPIAAIYFAWTPIKDAEGSYNKLESTKVTHLAKQEAAERAEKAYRAWQEQKKKEEAVAEDQGFLKQIFKPDYITTDKMSMFGSMLQDMINLAKRSGLRIRSMQFFSDLKGESLLEGRAITPEQQLALAAAAAAKSEKGGSKAPASAPVPAATQYRGYQVDFGFLGTYASINTFVNAVNNYHYLVKIKKVESYPYSKNPKILVANVSIVLYAESK